MAHPKGLLMERLKKLGISKPEFRTANTGPEHQPTFLSDVMVEGEVYGTGQGPTKREAERLAAEEALAFLDRNPVPVVQSATPAPSGRKREQDAQRGSEPGGTEDDRLVHDDDGSFEGPWPIFETLLSRTLEIANSRTDPRASGDEAKDAVRDFALALYKELLEDLGDIVEDEEED